MNLVYAEIEQLLLQAKFDEIKDIYLGLIGDNCAELKFVESFLSFLGPWVDDANYEIFLDWLSVNCPVDSIIFSNLAFIYNIIGNHEKSETLSIRSIEILPSSSAYCNLGLSQYHRKLIEPAITSFIRATELDEANINALYNLAKIYFDANNIELSIALCRECLALDRLNINANLLFGISLLAQGRLDNAFVHLNLSLRQCHLTDSCSSDVWMVNLPSVSPHTIAELRFLLFYIHALKGRIKWDLYESRLDMNTSLFAVESSCPKLSALDLDSSDNLLIVCEQGFGDVFLFARYAISLGLLSKYSITFVCHDDLYDLLVVSLDCIKVIRASRFSFYDKHDCWVPLASLPYYFEKARISEIFLGSPYLNISDLSNQKWVEMFQSNKMVKVALCWQGSKINESAPYSIGRSMQLEEFRPLADLDFVEFVALQKGDALFEIDDCTFAHKFIKNQVSISQSSSFVDTAAILSLCDLLITTDTSVAHLAGAMGVKTWLLLKSCPEWRWGLHSTNSPFYKSLKLWRQHMSGDWTSVVTAVKCELQRTVALHH